MATRTVNSVTLQEVLEHLPKAQKYGKYAVVNCLFHDDRNPSMFIYPDGYSCKSCGAHGTLDRLMEKLGKSRRFPSVTRSQPVVQKFYGPNWSLSKIEDYCLSAHQYLLERPEYGFYYEKRGVDSLIEKQLLGYLEGFFIIPIRDPHKSIVGAVARTGPSKSKFIPFPYFTPQGQKGMIWSPDWSKVQGTVYLPFGIFDALTLYQLGLPVIGFTNGKTIDPTLLQPLLKEREIYQVVIIPDRNEGRNKESHNAWKLAQTLSWRAKVKLLDYPEDCKDPNDVYVKYGADVLKEMLQC